MCLIFFNLLLLSIFRSDKYLYTYRKAFKCPCSVRHCCPAVLSDCNLNWTVATRCSTTLNIKFPENLLALPQILQTDRQTDRNIFSPLFAIPPNTNCSQVSSVQLKTFYR